MEEEDAALKLPVDQQWAHTKWNARQNAYKLITEKFNTSAPDDPCFSTWAPKLKSAATDSNVIALEAGLKCVSAFAQTAEPAQVDTLRASIVAPMAEKALPASKSSVKTAFQQSCQDLVEGSANPPTIIDELIPSLSLKNPKAVTASIINLRELYVNFGRVLPLKATLGALPALFAHNDKNIRAEASNLSVVLAGIGGKAVVESALANIKPVQLKELQPKLESAEQLKPLRIPRVMQSHEAEGDDDEASGFGQQGIDNEHQELDPYDMAEEVHLRNKLPDISAALGSVKWKERKEALENVEEMFNGVMRIAPDDFGVLASQLARVIQKDANIMCVMSAINISRMLASGLRKNFTYASTLVPPIVERFKEKKATAVESATNAAKAIYNAVGLDAVLPTICACLGHKAPQVRIESSKFLVNVLSEMPSTPSPSQVKEISEPAVKNMTDNQEPVRAEAAKILATLVKLVGKSMNPALAKLDDMRKQKVTDAADHVSISTRGQPAKVAPAVSRPPVKASSNPPTRSPPVSSQGVSKPVGATTRPVARSNTTERTTVSSRSPVSRESIVSPPVTSTPQKQPRPLHSTDFTPAKQAEPLRRRLGSPERPSASQLRARSPLKGASVPRIDQPDEGTSRHSPRQSPLATMEVDMLRREKLLAVKERDLLQKKFDQERVLRESAEMQVAALREEVKKLKWELNRHSSANSSLDGSNLDNLNNRISGMSIKDDSFEKLSSRPITLGTPRISSHITQADDELRAKQHEKSRENWRRAAEVTSSLKKRVEQMKRERMVLQQDSES